MIRRILIYLVITIPKSIMKNRSSLEHNIIDISILVQSYSYLEFFSNKLVCVEILPRDIINLIYIKWRQDIQMLFMAGCYWITKFFYKDAML